MDILKPRVGEHVFKMMKVARQSAFHCCDVTEDNGLKERNFLLVRFMIPGGTMNAWQVGSLARQLVASLGRCGGRAP